MRSSVIGWLIVLIGSVLIATTVARGPRCLLIGFSSIVFVASAAVFIVWGTGIRMNLTTWTSQ